MNYRYITTISITIIGLVSGIIGTKTHFFNKFTGTVTPVKQDPEKITGLLVAKGYAPTQQLITRLREKNRELEKELEAITKKQESSLKHCGRKKRNREENLPGRLIIWAMFILSN